MGRLSGGLLTEALPPANGTLIPQDWAMFAHRFIDEYRSDRSIPKPARTNALSRVVIADRNFDDIRGTRRPSASSYGALVNIIYNAPYRTIEESQARSVDLLYSERLVNGNFFSRKEDILGSVWLKPEKMIYSVFF
jgi:hypothetical protein